MREEDSVRPERGGFESLVSVFSILWLSGKWVEKPRILRKPDVGNGPSPLSLANSYPLLYDLSHESFLSGNLPCLSYPQAGLSGLPPSLRASSSTTQIKLQSSEHTTLSPEEEKCLEGQDFRSLKGSGAWQRGGSQKMASVWMHEHQWVNKLMTWDNLENSQLWRSQLTLQ